MNTPFRFKNVLVVLLQVLGAAIAFVISLVAGSMLAPMSPEITAATPESGFLSTPMAFLFNSVVNAMILVWVARRSSLSGLKMVGQLFVLAFGAQVFQTQIETGYFLSAFPMLQNNFQLYGLILSGLVRSLLFAVLVTLIVGGFSKKPRPSSAFTTTAAHFAQQCLWLPFVYMALYFLFGYFVAWQVQELRVFYGGPGELNGFFEQWGSTLMAKPELPVFQYFRGVLWMLLLVPLFRGFSGARWELVMLSALALGFLPTTPLAFANPLMPAAVSLGHFWEVAISTGIFGALCAWFLAEPVAVAKQFDYSTSRVKQEAKATAIG